MITMLMLSAAEYTLTLIPLSHEQSWAKIYTLRALALTKNLLSTSSETAYLRVISSRLGTGECAQRVQVC